MGGTIGKEPAQGRDYSAPEAGGQVLHAAPGPVSPLKNKQLPKYPIPQRSRPSVWHSRLVAQAPSPELRPFAAAEGGCATLRGKPPSLLPELWSPGGGCATLRAEPPSLLPELWSPGGGCATLRAGPPSLLSELWSLRGRLSHILQRAPTGHLPRRSRSASDLSMPSVAAILATTASMSYSTRWY